ncbi:uncharacterized protein LOC100386550 [Callithrix jacchus]
MAKVELLDDRQVEDADNPELGDAKEVLELAKPGEKEGWRNVMDEQSLVRRNSFWRGDSDNFHDHVTQRNQSFIPFLNPSRPRHLRVLEETEAGAGPPGEFAEEEDVTMWVTAGPRSLKDLQLLAEKPINIRVEGFLEEDRKAYFLRHFGEEDLAMRACELLRSKAPCSCWARRPRRFLQGAQLWDELRALSLLAAQDLWAQMSVFHGQSRQRSAQRGGVLPFIWSKAGGREAEDLRSRETPVPSPPGSRGSSGSQFNADTATGGVQNTSPSVLGSASTILKPAVKSDPSAVERGRSSERHLRLHRLLHRESTRWLTLLGRDLGAGPSEELRTQRVPAPSPHTKARARLESAAGTKLPPACLEVREPRGMWRLLRSRRRSSPRCALGPGTAPTRRRCARAAASCTGSIVTGGPAPGATPAARAGRLRSGSLCPTLLPPRRPASTRPQRPTRHPGAALEWAVGAASGAAPGRPQSAALPRPARSPLPRPLRAPKGERTWPGDPWSWAARPGAACGRPPPSTPVCPGGLGVRPASRPSLLGLGARS